MSPRDRELWFQVQRRANALSPDLARELLDAYRVIRESLSDAELARLITSGQFDQIVDDALLDRAFGPLRQKIVAAVESGFKSNAPNLPKAGKVDGRLAVMFDTLNPRVIGAVRELDSRVINTLREDVRDTVRAYVENGLRDGKAPKAIAREIRSVIGLTPNQLEMSDEYRVKLSLRTRKPLTEAQIDTKVAAYERRALAHSANTNARTAALDSLKLGQQLSWDDAIAKGILNPTMLWKRWVTVGDDRVRDSHQAMNGEEVPYGNTYSNGDEIPGESDFNCRCISRVFIKPQATAKAA